MGYKKVLRRICVGFVVLLLGLTFFSQTLSDMRVPGVTVAFCEPGVVTPKAIVSGIIEPATTELVYAPIDGTLTRLTASGSQTDGSAILFAIDGDTKDLRELLSQAYDEQSRIGLDIKRVENDIAIERRLITQLAETVPSADLLLEYELQLSENAYGIEAKEKELGEQKALLDMGLIPQQNVTETENELSALRLEKEFITARKEQAEKEQAESLTEQERARNAQIQNHQNTIDRLAIQMQAHALEAARTQQKTDALLERIEKSAAAEIRAEGNLLIMDIAPGMADGARVNQGDPVMRTARMDTRFMIKAALNRSQDFISVGQSASVAVEDKKISGVVDRVFPESGETIAVIAFSSDLSLYGKWAEITVSGPVASSNQVIPVSALREDNTGYYLLYIEAEERFLGYDYFARIRRVENVAARDAHYAAIEYSGLKEDTAIVINSDRPVYEGDRVRLTGGDDSFGAR